MKKKNYLFILGKLVSLVCITVTSSCNNSDQNASGKNTLIDSISIVKNYSKTHFQSAVVSFDSVHFAAPKEMEPIDFENDVKRYASNYDEYPAMVTINNTPMRGWRIYENDLELIRRKGNYKQLYLRLGRRGDGTYTLMVIPLTTDGKILYRGGKNPKKQPVTDPDNNYDHLDPCPDQCPTDFDQNP